MLSIRPEQDKVLQDYMFAQFRANMLRHLRSRFSSQTAGVTEPELVDLIVRGCAAAKRYNILGKEDIRRFLECLVVHGANFAETKDWARSLLLRNDLSGREKMDQIANYEVFSLRT